MRLLFLIYFLFFLRYGIIFPFIPLYAKHLGADPISIGLVVSSFNLLSFLMAFLAGIFSDRLGPKLILLISTIMNILYSTLLLLSKNLWILTSAQLIGGLGFLFMLVGGQVYISSQKDKTLIEKGFGWAAFSAALGQSIGPFLGGIIFSKSSFEGMFKLTLLIATTGLLVLALKDRTFSKKSYSLSFKGITSVLKEILNSHVVAVFLFSFIVLFVVSLRDSFLPILLKEKSLTEEEIGSLISIFAIGMSLIRLFIGRIFGLVSRLILVITTLFFISVATGILPLISSKFILSIPVLMIGFGFGISQPLSEVMISDFVPIGYLGISFGIRYSIMIFAALIGPFVFGLLTQKWGTASSFYVGSLSMIIVGSIIVALLKRSKPSF